MCTGYGVYYLKEFYIHHFVELKEKGEKNEDLQSYYHFNCKGLFLFSLAIIYSSSASMPNLHNLKEKWEKKSFHNLPPAYTYHMEKHCFI